MFRPASKSVLAASLLALSCSLAAAPPPLPAKLPTLAEIQAKYTQLKHNPQGLTDTERLHQIFETSWLQGMAASPEYATYMGFKGHETEWSDQSLERVEQSKKEQRWPLEPLLSIDRSKLSKSDQLNYDLFRGELELRLEGQKFPAELLKVNQMGGVQTAVADAVDNMPATTVQEYEFILGRMRGAPKIVQQNIDALKVGLKAGVVPPRIVMGEVPQQALRMLTDDPLQSPMLAPFKQFPESIPQAEQQRLRAEAVKIYKDQLEPAYRNLHKFLAETYLPKTRKDIGIGSLPNGAQWYAYEVRNSTTTHMTPKEIHDLGLSEVARIHAEMADIIKNVNFQGDFAAFMNYLRTDPKFYYTSEDDLLIGFRDIAKRIDPELTRLFGTLPRQPYGVKPVPAYSAASQPAGYYGGGSLRSGRPAYFYANTYNLPSRPKWVMESLVLHEGVPGHHLQVALAQEMEEVPEFRKGGGGSAFAEGWALYSEGLGGELGLYKDPYSKFGALSFEMWRAVRLVVDTGIHAFGWKRDQAIQYMMDNTGKDEHEATVEIDRYIVWPGQALAYKVGQLKIKALREYAQEQLGDKFDLRKFHDAVLADGGLPLDILEGVVKAWVAEQKAKP